MYADQCEECSKSFKDRHYTWFVCVTCHKDIDKKEHDERILSNEELE
jgi:methionyl-tRNA synthetase